jgi:hypothetical protein
MISESKIKEIVRSVLEEAYSEKLVQQLIDRFKEEEPGLSDSIAKAYIDRFQQIKNSPKVQEKDINRYSWKDLEAVIFANPGKRVKTKSVDAGQETIYNENDLEIKRANSLESCVKYGEGYNFCISARGEDNAYSQYRGDLDRTIYFVHDKNRPKTDPKHMMVVMVTQNVIPVENPTDTQYLLPSMDNDQRWNMRWQDLLRYQPKLKGFRSLFKYVPPSPQDQLQKEYETKMLELSPYYAKAKQEVSSEHPIRTSIPSFTTINRDTYNQVLELEKDEDLMNLPNAAEYVTRVKNIIEQYLRELQSLKQS